MEDLALEKDRRIKTRYQVLDDRVWGLRVAGKSVPITWLKDFNSEGASIRIGQFSGIKHGDQIRIELMCFEKPVFVGNALVRWSKICDETINMFKLGVQFLPSGATGLLDEKIVLQNSTEAHVEIAKEESILSVLTQSQFILTVFSSFMLGFALQLALH